MKIIKVSTDLEISIHDFPEGEYYQQNKALCKLIGNHCDIYEHVMPTRLYSELHMKNKATNVPGQCVSMLVDEEGTFKKNKENAVGSYLYETDKHGCPIMGNILLVGEMYGSDGIDFCGIEDSIFEDLYEQINEMISAFKEEGVEDK